MKTILSALHVSQYSSVLLVVGITLFNSAFPASAQSFWGGALSFDGANDAVSAPGITLTNTSMTIEVWAQTAQPEKWWNPFVTQGWGSFSNGLFFSYVGNAVGFGYYGEELFTQPIFTDTNWHHWAATHSRDTGERCIYRDGRIVSTDTNWGSYTGWGDLWIGEMPFSAPDFFGGQLDEVRVWNVARTGEEIRQHLCGRLTGQEPNLVGYWRFDEGSGAIAHDGSTNAHHGNVNGPQWAVSAVPEAMWGSALSFDGANDYLRVTIPPLANNYTVSAWVYLRAGGNVGGGASVVGVLSTTCGNSAEVLIRSQTTSSADPQYVELGRCNSFVGTPSTREVPLNEWTHIAVSVSPTKHVEYFINGIAGGSWNASAYDLTIGPNINLGDNSFRRFNGVLEDVRIWNKALTEAEIQADLAYPLTGGESNLVAYWTFDEGTGTIAHDGTATGHDGTLVNGPVWTVSTAPSGSGPAIELTSPQSPVWADIGKPMQFIVTGLDADNDLSYCDMGVGGVLVARQSFSSSNSSATCTFTNVFTQRGTNLVWFQAFDMQHNPSAAARGTVVAMPPPLGTNLTVLTYNTHLFEDSPLECIVRCAPDLDWSQYAYYDAVRKPQIIDRIKTSGADIVAVQEVWAHSWRESFRAPLQDIYPYVFTHDSSYVCEAGLWAYNILLPPCITSSATVNLPDDYAYRLHTQGNGLVLLSKYPLANFQFRRFPTYTQGDLTVKAAEETWADKGVMTADVDMNGTPLRIGISHALTGPDDYYSSWTQEFSAATINTFQDAKGQAYWFGVASDHDMGIVSRFEDYSWKDQAGQIHHAAGWKPVYSQNMGYGCAAATTFKLAGATYLFGLHGFGTNAAIIRRFNDDPLTGWTQTAMRPLSVNYTCLTSFELNGEPYIFMIYPPENNVYIRKINSDASGWTSTYQPFSASFLNFTSFKVAGRPYLLGIHANNNAYVYRVNDDASLTEVTHNAWAVDWVPAAFELDGRQHMFLRSAAWGTAHLREVTSPNPLDWIEHSVTDWSYSPTDYLTMKAFELKGHPYLFGMRRTVGDQDDSTKARKRPRDAFIWRVNDDGQGIERMLQLEDIRIIKDATVTDPNGPPAIMMGDFNVPASKYGIMDSIFSKVGAVDAYSKVHGTGDGGETICATNILYHYFWPDGTDYARIDFVYAQESGAGFRLEPTTALVPRGWRLQTPPAHNEDMSDHYPLLVQFRLQEEARLEAAPASAGAWQLSITGTIGRLCEVQYSPDLLTWDKLAELRIFDSPQLYTDTSPVTTGARFYRLRLLP